MDKNARVAHSAHPELVGVIHAIDQKDIAEVHFDGGGTGRFPLDVLVPEDQAKKTNKTWPPSNLETKALPG